MRNIENKKKDRWSQSAFLPGSYMGDNTILAHELAKYYTGKNISLSCMVKLDVKRQTT